MNKGQTISGILKMDANKSSSFDVTMKMALDGTGVETVQRCRLQDQVYHCECRGSRAVQDNDRQREREREREREKACMSVWWDGV